MTKQKNPAPGSTRTEMTAEELKWYQDFNDAYGDIVDDRKKTVDHKPTYTRKFEKIAPNPEMVPGVKKEARKIEEGRRKDIYAQQKAVHVVADEAAWDELFDRFVDGDSSVEYYIEDPTLNPKYPTRAKNEKYTLADYCKPGIPDEDGLIDAIDAERAAEDAAKIKPFKKRK